MAATSLIDAELAWVRAPADPVHVLPAGAGVGVERKNGWTLAEFAGEATPMRCSGF